MKHWRTDDRITRLDYEPPDFPRLSEGGKYVIATADIRSDHGRAVTHFQVTATTREVQTKPATVLVPRAREVRDAMVGIFLESALASREGGTLECPWDGVDWLPPRISPR